MCLTYRRWRPTDVKHLSDSGWWDVTATRIESTADVDEKAYIGSGTVVWHLAQIREDAVIGEQCVIGRGAYVDAGVRVGARVKIQNHALVYAPATLADGVFIGPAVVLTNDRYPRSVTVDGALRGADDWDMQGVTVGEGASLGARSVILAGVAIGRWALVAAGSVVTRDVPDHAIVAGNPARRRGWVGHAGVPLVADGELWRCPQTGETFVEKDDSMVVGP